MRASDRQCRAAPPSSWRVLGLTAGLLAALAAGLALGFVGTAFGAAERVLTGTGSATDPGPGTTTAPAATTAPPPDPAPVTVKKPPPRHVTPPSPPSPRTVKKSVPATAPVTQQPPPVVTPPPPAPASPPIAPAKAAVVPTKRAPVAKPRPRRTPPATRPRAQPPSPITRAARVLTVSTAKDFSRAPILVTLGLAIFLLGAAVIPPRVVPSAALAWVLSSQIVTISFAGLTLLVLAAIEYVVMKVAS